MNKTISIWLDDERDPTDPAIQAVFGAVGDEVWVKTAEAAISLLATEEVSRISLDNDLGPVEAGEGRDVAAFIEDCAFTGQHRVPGSVRIHTMNPVARAAMIRAIKAAERITGKSLLVG
jgi:hypothetical protein